jgi:hypothetical protein
MNGMVGDFYVAGRFILTALHLQFSKGCCYPEKTVSLRKGKNIPARLSKRIFNRKEDTRDYQRKDHGTLERVFHFRVLFCMLKNKPNEILL